MRNWFKTCADLEKVVTKCEYKEGVTGSDSVNLLLVAGKKVYWRPSTPNFANIDAASFKNAAVTPPTFKNTR